MSPTLPSQGVAQEVSERENWSVAAATERGGNRCAL